MCLGLTFCLTYDRESAHGESHTLAQFARLSMDRCRQQIHYFLFSHVAIIPSPQSQLLAPRARFRGPV
jgi:hypothetical protein